MKPVDPNPAIEVRHRTILILWFAMAMSLTMLLVLARFIPTSEIDQPQLSLILIGAGIVPLGMSFLLKQRLLTQAVTGQRLDLVQVAYVLAFALCEMAALLGLVDHFLSGSRYYYVGFLIAGMGLLLHFPRKQHLVDASSPQI